MQKLSFFIIISDLALESWCLPVSLAATNTWFNIHCPLKYTLYVNSVIEVCYFSFCEVKVIFKRYFEKRLRYILVDPSGRCNFTAFSFYSSWAGVYFFSCSEVNVIISTRCKCIFIDRPGGRRIGREMGEKRAAPRNNARDALRCQSRRESVHFHMSLVLISGQIMFKVQSIDRDPSKDDVKS